MSLMLDDLPRDPDRLLLMLQQMTEVIAQHTASLVSLQAERDAAQSRYEVAQAEIEKLRLLIRQLQRGQFGRRSEKLDPGQLQLGLEDGDGRYPRLMRALGGVKLLILDDWGLEPLGPEQRRDLLEIVEERYGRGATLITSQIPVDRWHDLIGEPTLADAILDRIVHNAHRLQLRGESLRKKAHQTLAA